MQELMIIAHPWKFKVLRTCDGCALSSIGHPYYPFQESEEIKQERIKNV